MAACRESIVKERTEREGEREMVLVKDVYYFKFWASRYLCITLICHYTRALSRAVTSEMSGWASLITKDTEDGKAMTRSVLMAMHLHH